MRSSIGRVLSASLLVMAIASVAQSQTAVPDPMPILGGEWELVDGSGDSGLSPLGQRGTIIQNRETLTIEPLTIARRPSNLEGRPRTFRFDGSETRETGTSATGDPLLRVSRSRWASSALLIITAHPPAGQSEGGWQELTTLSLRSDGHLEVVIVSPNLWPDRTTTITRLVYRPIPQAVR